MIRSTSSVQELILSVRYFI